MTPDQDWNEIDLPNPPKECNGATKLDLFMVDILYIVARDGKDVKAHGCALFPIIDAKLEKLQTSIDKITKTWSRIGGAWETLLVALGAAALALVVINQAVSLLDR